MAMSHSEAMRTLALARLRTAFPERSTLELVEVLLGRRLIPAGDRPRRVQPVEDLLAGRLLPLRASRSAAPQWCPLRVPDARFYLALAIEIADATRQGDVTIVRQHVRYRD
jgi:hypothetical protein